MSTTGRTSRLDEYINLKERVENRMVIADVTATGDDNPLDSESNEISYRKEQLRRLQEEVIDMEDVKTGVSITDLGLNDFRMDLLNYVKTHGDLANLPSGMHAVVPADPERGLPPGRDLHPAQPQPRGEHQPAEPPASLLPGLHRKRRRDHRQPHRGETPARSRPCRLPRDEPSPIHAASSPSTRPPTTAANMGFYSGLLDQAIRSIVQVKDEKDLDSLFTGSRTSALTNPIAGLDDFELLSFIVAQEQQR